MSDDPAVPADPSIRCLRLFSPTERLPRHSEGDLIRLDDGALLLVWTRFTAGDGGDHDPASLVASRFDDSTGRWSADQLAVESSDGMNVMSVSLRRLPDDRLALFHLHKRSLVDCRPVVRFSSDEARTWSDAVEIVPATDVGYDVLNNDRVLQGPDGMLLLAVARHAGNGVGESFRAAGRLRCHRSSDGGSTWHAGEWAPEVPGVVLQEPGLFHGDDGTLRLFARTDAGVQYCADSRDDGRTWSVPRPWTLPSPLSPASIERLPGGDLLAIWNDPGPDCENPSTAPRTPLVAARSADDGRTWGARTVLLDHPDGWYCYVAQLVEGDRMLLATCAGDRSRGNGLETMVVLDAPLPVRGPEGANDS